MTVWKRLPIRHRLTLAFATRLVMVATGLSVFVYVRTGADLLDTVDAGLRSRAELLVADLQHHGPELVNVAPTLIESDEVFAQIAGPAGRVVQSTSTVSQHPLLPARAIASLEQARYFDRKIPGVDNVTRVLAVPAVTGHGRFVVMVGTSLQDRLDELTQLAVSLTVGGLAATALICGGVWLLLAGALRPVERMRSQAAAITALDAGRRLSPPAGKDELASLAATLNQMLDRIQAAVTAERQLVDWASHELRTPLAIQRMDLDLALTGPQTVPELRAALESMSAENTHLTRLTEDLLVLSRARHGALPIRRVNVPLHDLLAGASLRASQRNQAVSVVVRSSGGQAFLDPVWLRHALDNLIDNAIRHSAADGQVDVSAIHERGAVLLAVEDSGPGFSEAALATAFQPRQPPGGNGQPSAGLGLAVVRTIAEAHGGRVWAENRPDGGARVTLFVPDR
jgi:signal transduction histidine kinase